MSQKVQQDSTYAFVVVAIVIITAGLLGFIFWQSFIYKESVTIGNKAENSTMASLDEQDTDDKETTIHPTNQLGEISDNVFTIALPEGWSVQYVYEADNIVKTTSDDKQYLISSFIGADEIGMMENNMVGSGEVIKTLATSKGTSVSIIKTPSELTLASCYPTGNNCYLDLNDQALYIHLYWNKPGAQSAVDLDYSTASAQEIIGDFEKIAASLNI